MNYELEKVGLISQKGKSVLKNEIESFLKNPTITVNDNDSAIEGYRIYKLRNLLKKKIEDVSNELSNPFKLEIDKIEKDKSFLINSIYESCRQSLVNLNNYISETPEEERPSGIKVSTRYEENISSEKAMLLIQKVAEGELPLNLFNINMTVYNKLRTEGKIPKKLMFDQKKIDTVTGRNI